MAHEFKVPVGTPRLTQTEIDALASPQRGWVVCNTTTGNLQTWNGSSWSVVPDLATAIPAGSEFLLVPVNNPGSGRKYRIQIYEVLNNETGQLDPVIQIVPA